MRKASTFENLHTSLLSPYRIAMAGSLEGVILDCGGGLGEYLKFFKARRVIVMDISLDALRQLEHTDKVCASGLALPFADSFFDGVWACAVAQYMELEPFIAELMRVTRPGGRILALMPNANSYWDRLKKFMGMTGWWDQQGIVCQYGVKDLQKYGKVSGEVRFLPGEALLRNFPGFGHTLMLEIIPTEKVCGGKPTEKDTEKADDCQ